MNRNVNSFFANTPQAHIQRSAFPRNSRIRLTANVGQIIPFYVDEVLPADTFKIETSKVVRLQTLVTPMMDNLTLDTYYFYVPLRIIHDHAKEFFGENTQSAWIQQNEYTIPQITAPNGGWNVGTIADYMGIPTGVGNLSVSALPFRAYALIINEFFRSEVVDNPLVINKTDSTVVGSNGSTFVTDVALGGAPYIANKFFDYFTGATISPQKGPDVEIPVGQDYELPVLALNKRVSEGSDYTKLYPMYFSGMNDARDARRQLTFTNAQNDVALNRIYSANAQGNLSNLAKLNSDSTAWSPINLWAVGSGSVGAATINQLRMAFAMQKFFEREATAGSRYNEILLSMFGVSSGDARLQRPEYLGGNRIPISVQQVTQQSESGTTPQGTNTGMSLTSDKHFDVKKSFVEHGFIIGLMVMRYKHSYQQGLERFWSRKTKYDFYWPLFQNLGNQAILNKEIYAQGSSAVNASTGVPYDDEVFGYAEYAAEYRYKPDRIAGEMRSAYAQSLDSWHLADDYNSLPSLSSAWLKEDKTNVDRVLAVTSAVSNQYFADIYVKNTTIRPMPVHSTPGLIDHH